MDRGRFQTSTSDFYNIDDDVRPSSPLLIALGLHAMRSRRAGVGLGFGLLLLLGRPRLELQSMDPTGGIELLLQQAVDHTMASRGGFRGERRRDDFDAVKHSERGVSVLDIAWTGQRDGKRGNVLKMRLL